MSGKDYYNVLGVSKSSSQAEIKTAFRKLAHKHHPDKGGDDKKFKEINEAYQVLGNEKKRQQYDQFGSSFNNSAGAGGFDPSGFQGGFSGAGANINFDDLGDIFGDMFGFSSGGSRRERGVRKGENIEAILEIDFMDSVFGTEKEILVDKKIKCEKCNGQGAEPGSKIDTCTSCKGSGRVFRVQRTIFGAMQSEAVCHDCQGEGKTYSKKCSKCSGFGVYNGREKIKIKIPAGINNGESIRLSERGHGGLKGAPAGDLRLQIRIKPSTDFERRDYNIYTRETIDVKQAILGDKIKVKTVHGEIILKIPEGTQPGTVFKIKNKGVPKLRGTGNGDHFVEVLVKIPKSMSRKNKKILEEVNF
jgi:molecular chaperone DnaJ